MRRRRDRKAVKQTTPTLDRILAKEDEGYGMNRERRKLGLPPRPRVGRDGRISYTDGS